MADLKATLKTNQGDIVIDLFPNHAPETVENFVGLAEGTKDYRDDAGRSGEKYYDGLGFHRVIEGFMIQGGCPLGTGTGGPGYTFKDEIHPELVFDKPYLLAMANAGPAPTARSSSSPWAPPRGSTASTRSSARWPTRPAATWSTRSAASPDRCDGPPAEPVRHRVGHRRALTQT